MVREEMRNKEEGAGNPPCPSRASALSGLQFIRVPRSPRRIMLVYKLLMHRPFRTPESKVLSKKSPQKMCCVDLIFVYILLSREMTGEVEFPSDFGHSELRRPLLSPPTPSSMLDLSACRVDMWSSAVAPLVGRD